MTAAGSPRTCRPCPSSRPTRRASSAPSAPSTLTRCRPGCPGPAAGRAASRTGYPNAAVIRVCSRRAATTSSRSATTTSRPSRRPTAADNRSTVAISARRQQRRATGNRPSSS